MYRNSLSPPVFPCPWASEWGEDCYGLWQTLVCEGVRQVFRWIEPGSFMMGSPTEEAERFKNEELRYKNEVLHQVTFKKGFWLADTTVTQAMWLAVVGGKNPSHFQDHPDNPVEMVSWDDAQRFVTKLNLLFTTLAAQLPTEAQWEYACRASTDPKSSLPFSFGFELTSTLVNYNGHFPYADGTNDLYREKTVPVKSLPANPWGLYEMHGNVWEWCMDAWQRDLGMEPVNDPLILERGSTEAEAGGTRIVRGGSWSDDGRGVRSAMRNRYSPGLHFNFLGFRLALGLTV